MEVPVRWDRGQNSNHECPDNLYRPMMIWWVGLLRCILHECDAELQMQLLHTQLHTENVHPVRVGVGVTKWVWSTIAPILIWHLCISS